jgi:hypothetical protein
VEFADTVRSHRYIGPKGWPAPSRPRGRPAESNGVLHPTVAATIKQIDQGLPRACQQVSWAIDYARYGHVDPYVHPESQHSGNTELLIIDEADRLKTAGLEQVRDFYDRHHMGVILIGMPGIEKRLARPQLYSRVGFAHEYRSLRSDELTAVVTQRLPAPDPGDSGLAHTAALAAIVRATNGNFRLADRLVTQIRRVLDINGHTPSRPRPSTPPRKPSSSDTERRDNRDIYRCNSQSWPPRHSIFFANGLDLPWERAPTWDPAVFEIVDSALTA